MFIPLLARERSIDDFIDKEGSCRLAAVLADKNAMSQDEKLYLKELRHLVLRALIKLDDRERHIIQNRFGIEGGGELTLEEIGRSLNLSRERVRQLEREAKSKLRANLIRHQPDMRMVPA